MKKLLFLSLLMVFSAAAYAQIDTRTYREMTRKHERMLAGTQSVPAARVEELSVGAVSYTNTCWDDLTVSALNLFDPPGSAGVAIVAVTTGLYAAEFSVGESGTGIAQTKHSMKAGTALRPHLHVVGNAAAPATNVWVLAMNSATNSGGTFDRPYSGSVTGVVSFAEEKMLLLPEYTNYLSESSIVGFVVSNASGATAHLLDVDFHFQIEKPGSDEANPFE